MVEEAFAAEDDKEIERFAHRDRFTLGLDEYGAISGDAQKNRMPLWEQTIDLRR